MYIMSDFGMKADIEPSESNLPISKKRSEQPTRPERVKYIFIGKED